jgi:hypothetical protein
MFTSDLLKQGAASPTTLVASTSGVATTNYTPTTTVEIKINGSTNTGGAVNFSVNSIVFNIPASSQTSICYYASAGQAQVITGTLGSFLQISARKVD